jgi:hypothetical protein
MHLQLFSEWNSRWRVTELLIGNKSDAELESYKNVNRKLNNLLNSQIQTPKALIISLGEPVFCYTE